MKNREGQRKVRGEETKSTEIGNKHSEDGKVPYSQFFRLINTLSHGIIPKKNNLTKCYKNTPTHGILPKKSNFTRCKINTHSHGILAMKKSQQV